MIGQTHRGLATLGIATVLGLVAPLAVQAPGAGPIPTPAGTPTSSTPAVTLGGGCGVTATAFDGQAAGIVGIDRAVAAGSRVHGVDTFGARIVAFDEDGHVDLDYGDGGVASTIPDVAAAVGRTDGRVLLAGIVFEGPRRVELLQLTAEGRPDPAFSGDGRLTIALDGESGFGTSTVRMSPIGDDVLVVSRGEAQAAVAWVHPDGTLKPGFGTDGVARFDAAPDEHPGTATVDTAGRVIVSGFREVWRLTPAGVLDPEFGTDGLLWLDGDIGTQTVHVVDADTLAYAAADFGNGQVGTVDLVTGTVSAADDPLPVDGEARYVGDRLVVAAREGLGFGASLVAAERRTLAGAVDTAYAEDGRTEVDVFDTIRLDVTLIPTVHDDGAVSAVGIGEAWDHEPIAIRVHIDRDGALVSEHGWCPDDDGPSSPRVTRLAGADRAATAVVLSEEGYPDGAEHVLLATGSSFPDALAGGPAAAQWRGPVLLVTREAVPDVVVDELERLAPARVSVLGGPTAIDDAVLAEVDAITGVTPNRLSGPDRYTTAVEISRAAFGPGVPVAFVTTGENFPDALAAGAVAGTLGGPILLVTRTTVPDVTLDELDRLQPEQIVVLGGPNAIGDAYERLAERHGDLVVPVAGQDRYATARDLNEQFRDEYDGANGRPVTTVFVATGSNFPDALAGAALAGTAGGVITLVERDRFDERVRDYLGRVHPRTIYVLGGEVAVGKVWVDELRRPNAVSYTWLTDFRLFPHITSPVRWNCDQAIPWVFNPDNEPPGGLAMMKEGLARITETTGWQFEYRGLTDEPVFAGGRQPYQPSRYGSGWAPVLMGWAELPFGGAAGQGGPTWVENGTTEVAVSGELGLNMYLDLPTTFDEDAWGDIFLHEVGHVLGLDHPGDPTQTMYWITVQGVSGLQDGDLAGMQRLRDLECLPVPPPFPGRRTQTADRP